MTPLNSLKVLGEQGGPHSLEVGCVFPIYSKRCEREPENDRPVSLTSGIGKVMERNIMGTTESHSKRNAIFRHRQVKVRKWKSCLTKFYPSMLRSPAQRMKGRLDPKCELAFFIFKSLLTLSFTISSWTSCPTVRWEGTSCIGWRTGIKGLLWMCLTGCWCCSSGLNSRSVFVPYIFQLSGCRNWQICW